MDKTFLVSFMVLCLLSTVFLLGYKATVKGSFDFHVHNLDTGLDYATIQEAVNANETLDGHSIYVDAGIYYENVVVNKSIRLIGEDKETTIIDGNGTGNVVYVTANNVTIIGFTIQWSEVYLSGIYVERADDVNISNNIIEWNDYGITLMFSHNSILCGNEVLRNWPGITLKYSNNNTICGNIISHNKEPGVSLSASDNNLIFNNKFLDNLEDIVLIHSEHNVVVSNEITVRTNEGIHVYVGACNNVIANNSIWGYTPASHTIGIEIYSNNDNVIIGNNISYHRIGIWLWESSNTVLSCNRISNNTEGGIYLGSYCSDNILIGNEISHNKAGIWLYIYCHKNTIIGNTVSSNSEFGIQLENSGNNTIFHNNFINNTDQALASAAYNNTWNDGYPLGGNYWSDYNSTDLYSGRYQNETGSDGVGDSPYVIDEHNQDNYPLTSPIPPYYYLLLERYNELLGSFRDLNSTYHSLLANFDSLNSIYNNLLSDYNKLQTSYNQLNSSYTTLQESHKELQSQQEAIINELNTIKNLMYTFITTTISLITTTIYLITRKLKD